MLVFLAALAAFLAIYRAWPQAEPGQALVAATLVTVVILWISEVIPLFVSALIGSFLLLALGDFSATTVFQPYFDPVIVLRENGLLHTHSRFARGAVLAVAYAATIGGIGSLVGSPPSAIAYSTGVVNVRQMIKNGFLVNLGTGSILVLLYYLVYL